MLTFSEFQDAVASTLFDGNTALAGLAIYAVVMLLIFVIARDSTISLIGAILVAFVFSLLGILGSEVLILVIAVAAIALSAVKSRGVSLAGLRASRQKWREKE